MKTTNFVKRTYFGLAMGLILLSATLLPAQTADKHIDAGGHYIGPLWDVLYGSRWKPSADVLATEPPPPTGLFVITKSSDGKLYMPNGYTCIRTKWDHLWCAGTKPPEIGAAGGQVSFDILFPPKGEIELSPHYQQIVNEQVDQGRSIQAAIQDVLAHLTAD